MVDSSPGFIILGSWSGCFIKWLFQRNTHTHTHMHSHAQTRTEDPPQRTVATTTHSKDILHPTKKKRLTTKTPISVCLCQFVGDPTQNGSWFSSLFPLKNPPTTCTNSKKDAPPVFFLVSPAPICRDHGLRFQRVSRAAARDVAESQRSPRQDAHRRLAMAFVSFLWVPLAEMNTLPPTNMECNKAN